MVDGWSIVALIAVCIVACIVLEFILKIVFAPGFKVADKHVLITGGSTGLGLALAKDYAKRGAKVSILARNKTTLQKAKQAIDALGGPECFMVSADVSDYKAMTVAVEKSIVFHGAGIDHLICCAGFSTPGYFVDEPVEAFRKQMDVNYYGTLHAIKAVVPNMIENETKGRIVLVSSACAYIGFIGFTSYCPTKFALRGLADSLRNEMLMYGISVSIYYPGSMDTPGFVEEEKIKPAETRYIEGTSALVSPESAAKTLISGLRAGQYAITNDIGVWVLRAVGNGMAPRYFAVLEMILAPLFVAIQLGYLAFMDHVVKKAKSRLKRS